MVYLIVHSESWHNYGNTYSSESKAKTVLKNARVRGHRIDRRKYQAYILDELVVMSAEDWRKGDTYITVTSLNAYGGDPAPVQIRRSERGGPCDPSTERYWCM